MSSNVLPTLDPESFREIALRRLRPLPSAFEPSAPSNECPSPSDFDLNPDAYEVWRGSRPLRPAAVLVPIVARPSLTFLLTERTAHLARHAGQIAFPGGRPEPFDRSPAETAIREAHEEIGLDPRSVDAIGVLPTYVTGTGFTITPVVALIRPPSALVADPNEVAEVFEVPLPFLMDPRNHRLEVRSLAGAELTFYAMPYGNRYIWGATAGILRKMQEMLFPS